MDDVPQSIRPKKTARQSGDPARSRSQPTCGLLSEGDARSSHIETRPCRIGSGQARLLVPAVAARYLCSLRSGGESLEHLRFKGTSPPANLPLPLPRQRFACSP